MPPAQGPRATPRPSEPWSPGLSANTQTQASRPGTVFRGPRRVSGMCDAGCTLLLPGVGAVSPCTLPASVTRVTLRPETAELTCPSPLGALGTRDGWQVRPLDTGRPLTRLGSVCASAHRSHRLQGQD